MGVAGLRLEALAAPARDLQHLWRLSELKGGVARGIGSIPKACYLSEMAGEGLGDLRRRWRASEKVFMSGNRGKFLTHAHVPAAMQMIKLLTLQNRTCEFKHFCFFVEILADAFYTFRRHVVCVLFYATFAIKYDQFSLSTYSRA